LESPTLLEFFLQNDSTITGQAIKGLFYIVCKYKYILTEVDWYDAQKKIDGFDFFLRGRWHGDSAEHNGIAPTRDLIFCINQGIIAVGAGRSPTANCSHMQPERV
jgi:hypothetical protein